MTAFRQFSNPDVLKACNDYITNYYEMLQSTRTSKINRLMSRKWLPKKTEIDAVNYLKDHNDWNDSDIISLTKLDKVKELQSLCSLKSIDPSVTLDADLAKILRLYF